MKQALQDELARIYGRDGILHPATVIAEARNKRNPLHAQFTWDDTKAAEAHRMNEARNLIRVAVKVIPAISNQAVREYVSISTMRRMGTGSYLATVDVVADDERRAQALADAIKTLTQLERRFGYLEELAPIWDALRPIARTVTSEAA